jgi:hypothetical protein
MFPEHSSDSITFHYDKPLYNQNYFSESRNGKRCLLVQYEFAILFPQKLPVCFNINNLCPTKVVSTQEKRQSSTWEAMDFQLIMQKQKEIVAERAV